MVTVRSMQEYRRVWQKRIRNIKKQANISAKDSAEIIKLTAKRNAPRKSRQTINGIRSKQRKSGQWIVESWVPGMFKQNMFANRSPPFDILNYGEDSYQPFYAIPQTVVYGDRAITPGGKLVKWTAYGKSKSMGFFNYAIFQNRKTLKKFVVRNTRKALRVNIG